MEIVILVTYKFVDEDGSNGDGHETVYIVEPFEPNEFTKILTNAIREGTKYTNIVFTSVTDISAISSHSKFLSELKQRS